MNVRDATRDDEPWILDTLDELGSPDPGFRWYDYVVVETDDGDRVGTGRLTEHDDETVELTHVGGVGDRPATAAAYAVKGLVERAIEDGYGTILAVAERPRPYEVVGFRPADGDADDAVEAADGGTVLRWVPSSERDDGDETAETDEETTAGDGETGERDGTGDVASQQADADADGGDDRGRRTKYATAPSDADSSANAARADGDGPIDGGAGGAAGAHGDGASAATGNSGDGASETDGGGSSYKYDTSSPSTAGADGSDSESADESSTTREDSTADAARRQGIDPDSVNAKYGTEGDDESKRTKYDA